MLCVGIVILLGVTACTGGRSPVTAPSSAAPTTSPDAQATGVAIRRCSTNVTMPEGTAWRQGVTVVGPLILKGGNWAAPEAFNRVPPHLPDGTRFLKTPVILEPDRQATVTLPPEERSEVALAYGDPHARVRIDEGQYSVTFVACSPVPGAPPETFFNGGFLLRSPQCVTLDLSYEDRTQRLVLPFGTVRCPRK